MGDESPLATRCVPSPVCRTTRLSYVSSLHYLISAIGVSSSEYGRMGVHVPADDGVLVVQDFFQLLTPQTLRGLGCDNGAVRQTNPYACQYATLANIILPIKSLNLISLEFEGVPAFKKGFLKQVNIRQNISKEFKKEANSPFFGRIPWQFH